MAIKISIWRVLLVALFVPLTANAATTEATLDNGLKVIVKEDHRAPVVVSQVWYRAGSIDEFNGTTGVAHVLEHMMFQGTKKVPSGKFSQLIAAAGGSENAFTNNDYTAYFQTLQKSKLGLAFKLEADRMHNLLLAPKEYDKEIKVVREERRWRTDDKPQALVYEQLMATAFQENPYRRPVIGWMNDLETMTVQDARNWYHRWYTPDNAVLVVVGDVEPQAVIKLAKEYFGKIKPEPLPVRKPQDEPPQLGIKRIVVKAPAKLPYLLMGYHVPALHDANKDWEPYALEVLAGVLDGDEASRFTKDLVRGSQVASSAGAGYDDIARGPGMFLLDGVPSEGKTVGDLEAALRAEIDKVKKDGVTADEMQRVKTSVIASQVYQRDSMFYQAMLIGQFEMTGLGYKAIDTRIQKLKAVTADQVQAVAKKYFNDDSLTVAVLEPQPLEGRKPVPRPKGLHDVQ